MFYYLYNDYKINSKKIVVLTEEFSFGRNTKIVITIDSDVLYEFLARPDEEYLNEMAEQAIYATYLYLKNVEKQNKYFTQY